MVPLSTVRVRVVSLCTSEGGTWTFPAPAGAVNQGKHRDSPGKKLAKDLAIPSPPRARIHRRPRPFLPGSADAGTPLRRPRIPAPHSSPAFLDFRGRRPAAQMTTPSGPRVHFRRLAARQPPAPPSYGPTDRRRGRGSGFCCCMEPTCRIRLARSRRTTSKSTTSAPEPAGNRQFPCIKSCKPNTVLGSRFRDGPDSL